jgi:hypothetical protein
MSKGEHYPHETLGGVIHSYVHIIIWYDKISQIIMYQSEISAVIFDLTFTFNILSVLSFCSSNN